MRSEYRFDYRRARPNRFAEALAGRTPATGTRQVDTAEARVTEWRLPAGSAIGHHRHELDYVVVPITDGVLTVVSAGGSAQSPITRGQSYFRKAGVEHDVRNETEAEIVFVEIEIKAPLSGRPGR